MFESLLFRPNFPTAPSRSFDFFTFPNDLVTDKRQYFTEIQFFEYTSGSLGKLVGDLAAGGAVGAAVGGAIGGPIGAILGGGFGAGFTAEGTVKDIYNNGFEPQGKTGNVLGHMRLPIPMRINDTVAFSWGEDSLKDISTQILNNFAFGSNKAYIGLQIGELLAKGGGVLSGYSLNPLFFQTFQHQNFREFSFHHK